MAFPKSPCLSVRQMERLQAQQRASGEAPLPTDSARPKTLEECTRLPRPCPFVGCRHHLFLNVSDIGTIQFPFGDDVEALNRMPATCSLDVAEQRELSLGETGNYLNLSHEWVRRFQKDGVAKLHKHGVLQELDS